MPERASFSTLQGQLQRGHGAAFARALKLPQQEIWPLLYDCVTQDWRFDRQVEDRCRYYAKLIVATSMDIASLNEFNLKCQS